MSLQLAVKITADASGVKPGTEAARQSFQALGSQIQATSAIAQAANTNLVNVARQSRQAAIDAATGVKSDFGGAERAADIAAYGKALDDLRARYNPLFAAEQAHREQLEGIAAAQRLGAISATEAADAAAVQQAAYTRQVSVINAARGAVTQHGAAAKLSAFQLQQLTFQGNDVATMYLAGASTGQIFATQAGQILQVLQMSEGGFRGSLAAIGSWAGGIGRSILALATPLNIGLLGVTALAGGVLAYAMSGTKSLQSVDDALAQHADFIKAVRDAYGEAAVAADAYGRETLPGLRIAGQDDVISLQDQLRSATESFLTKTTIPTDLAGTSFGPDLVAIKYSAFAKEIEALQKSAAEGTPDIKSFRDAVQRAIVDEPVTSSYRTLGKELLDATKKAGGLDSALQRSLLTLNNVTSGAAQAAARAAQLGKALGGLGEIARQETQGDKIARLYREQLVTASTPGSRAALEAEAIAARNRVAGDIFKPVYDQVRQQKYETETLQQSSTAAAAYLMQRNLLLEAAKAGIRLTKEERDAAADLAKTYGDLLLRKKERQTSSQLIFDASQIGRSPIEQQVAATLRDLYGPDYLAHMNESIAGTIRQNAELKAMDDAANTARDSMEKLQLQLALVGKPKAEQSAALAGLEADQLIRRQGLEGTAAADLIRKNAAEIAAATAELERNQALATARTNAAFDRAQIARSSIEQQVATTMRGIYGDEYLQHMQDYEAQQIRNNAALKSMHDAAATARDSMEKLLAQMDLIGKPIAEQNRALALLDAEQQIRRDGLSGGAAEMMRSNATAIADATTELERQQAAWSSWSDEAGGAIDSVVGDLATGKLGVDTLTSTLEDASKWIAQMAIANPLKNALLGENNATLTDVIDRLSGKKVASDGLASALASTVSTMSVSAATVIVNGGAGAVLGAAANDNLGQIARSGGIGSDHVASMLAANDNLNIRAAGMAIKTIESGSPEGNYSARGPVLASGDRAYGAYQVMGENVPSWTRKWTGRSMSPSEFLGDSTAQDAVFHGQFGSYAGRYGATGAAQAWLGGPGSIGKLDRADINGTTVGGYGSRFDNLYKQFSGLGSAADTTGKAMTTAAGSADRLGGGLGDLASSAQSAAGGLGRLIQGIPGFGGAGAVLGGGFTASTGWLYDVGGYTGAGPKDRVAGLVHAGEVVFSQADVARSGGVSVVEAVRRRGLAGYAAGGAIDERGRQIRLSVAPMSGAMAAAAPAPAAANGNGNFPEVKIINNGQPVTKSKQTGRTGADGSRELIIELGEAVASEASRDGSTLDRAINRQRLVGR